MYSHVVIYIKAHIAFSLGLHNYTYITNEFLATKKIK